MAGAANDRNLVAGEAVLGQQLANFQLDQLEQLGVVDQVDLFRNTTNARHTDLAGQQDVLAGLRHRAVGGRHDQDRAVHLGGAGDHVLDEVGVARAVDVGVVPLVGLVLDVADTAMVTVLVSSRTVPPLAISAYDLKFAKPFGALDRQNGAGERGLAVVDVADRADVDVRLFAFEMCPWPLFLPD